MAEDTPPDALGAADSAADASDATGAADPADVSAVAPDADEAADAPDADEQDSPEQRLDRLIREGLLIAESVVVMRVKNRIIMRVLGDAGEVDRETADAYVEEATLEVVHETRESAARLRILIAEARHAPMDSRQRDTEFGPKDVETLRLRRRTDLGLADALAERAQTEEYRRSLVERARQAAMDDMFRARLNTDLPVDVNRRDPDYRYRQLQELSRQLGHELHQVERRRKRAELLDRLRFWKRRPAPETTNSAG